MNEFEIVGQTYRAGTIDAMRQFHMARRLAPALASMGSAMSSDDGQLAMIGALADAIGQMSDADSEYVLNVCLNVVTRQQAGGTGWAKIRANNGAMMFDDIDLAVMLQIVVQVLGANLAGFFSALPAILPGLKAAPQG